MTQNNAETVEFIGFPKMGRLSRECIITEKIDGTNAQIYITEDKQFLVGSRTRWITPGNDNFGFAAWAYDHKDELMQLGPGRHFGEWWGRGIQRHYNHPGRTLSLFNVSRWVVHGAVPAEIKTQDPRITRKQEILPPCCSLVPVIYRGEFTTDSVNTALETLKQGGSLAAPGFMNPEGVICFHTAANVGFKKTLGGDGAKGSENT